MFKVLAASLEIGLSLVEILPSLNLIIQINVVISDVRDH